MAIFTQCVILHKKRAARKPLKFVWFGLGQSSIAAIANAVKQIPDTPMVNKVIKPKANIKSFISISRDLKKRGPMEFSPVKKWGGTNATP